MEINKEKIRYILQYHYDKGKNAAQACEKICAIYEEYSIKISSTEMVRSLSYWKFRCEKKDELRSGRPITEKSDEIMVKVEHDKHVSTVEIARKLGTKQF